MLAPAPKLSEDLLYAVSEQMLFTKHTKKFFGHQVDLRQENAYTNFMQLNSTTMKVFLAHFVKMKEIEFNESIKMYRDTKKVWDNSKDNAFYGPYLVTKEFVRTLLDLRKLSLSSVSVYAENFGSDTDEDKKPETYKFPVQVFSKLFLDQDLSDQDAEDVRFELSKLRVQGITNGLGTRLKNFLNLNAKEIDVEIYEMHSPDFTAPICATLTNRVEKFALRFSCQFDQSSAYIGGTSNAQFMNWHNLLHSLLISCPSIKMIDLKVFFEFRPAEHEGFLQHFSEMVDEFVDKIFPSLSEGNEKAQILVALELNCSTYTYQDLSLSSCELFKRGDTVTLDLAEQSEEYSARECRVVDPRGREHKCAFQVLAQEVSYGSDVLADVLSLQSNDYDGQHYSYYDVDNDYDYDDYDINDSDYY